MKKTKLIIALCLPLATGLLTSCEDFGSPFRDKTPGELTWTIRTGSLTKAASDIPDTNDFILTVKNAAGKVLYNGSYGDSPTSLEVEPGSYTVSAQSTEFTTPAFARPLYGDEQVVVVSGGQKVNVRLDCTLLNCGVTLQISPDFLTSHPDGVLFLKQASTRLMHAYTEKRIAYFFPGEVSLLLYEKGMDNTLLTKRLAARDVLSIKISAPSMNQASGSISVAVDTSKNWITEYYTIGGDNSGNGNSGVESSNAISVGDARSHIGEEDVWVYGYIVGGDLTSNGKSVKTSGITKPSHIAIAARSSVTEKASCVAVELPAGNVREALNLVDHPDLIGTRIFVKGDLVESYFGTIGLKGTSDYARK